MVFLWPHSAIGPYYVVVPNSNGIEFRYCYSGTIPFHCPFPNLWRVPIPCTFRHDCSIICDPFQVLFDLCILDPIYWPHWWAWHGWNVVFIPFPTLFPINGSAHRWLLMQVFLLLFPSSRIVILVHSIPTWRSWPIAWFPITFHLGDLQIHLIWWGLKLGVHRSKIHFCWYSLPFSVVVVGPFGYGQYSLVEDSALPRTISLVWCLHFWGACSTMVGCVFSVTHWAGDIPPLTLLAPFLVPSAQFPLLIPIVVPGVWFLFLFVEFLCSKLLLCLCVFPGEVIYH